MGARRVVVGMVAAAVGVLGLLPASASAADDLTCPVLISVTAPTSPVGPGETLALDVRATDDVELASVLTRWSKVDRLKSALTVSSAVGDPGTVSTVVAPTQGDGEYRLDYVDLRDAAGNRVRYTGERFTCDPVTRVTTSGPHTVDLVSPSFVIAGATDRTTPILLALQVPDVATLNRPTPIRWRVADSSPPLTVRAEWKATAVDVTPVVSVTNAPLEGSADLTLDAPFDVQLQSVVVSDAVGNTSTYLRDGSVLYASSPGPSGLRVPGANPFDFSTFDVDILPLAPGVRVRPVPGGAVLEGSEALQRPATLRLTLQPGNIIREVQAPADSRVRIAVPGLCNGVTYSYTVTATNAAGTGPAVTGEVVPRLSTNIAVLQDFTNDRKADVVALQPEVPGAPFAERVRLYATDGRAHFTGTRTLSGHQGWRTIGPAHPGGYYPETLGTYLRVDEGGDLVEQNANVPPVTLGRGWSSLRSLDGGFDLTGDGTGDIIAVASDGNLRLYARTLSGKVLRQNDIGTGWGSMLAVFSAGDLNGDRRNDVVAADAAGRLWLYPGNGHGRVTARRQIGSGWAGMGSIFAMRDFDGDGRADVGAVAMDGRLLMYRGTGSGGLRPGVRVGTGWHAFF
ncbi:FG-GAP repeat domain-containing protein [Phycicoccus avicenniae]|uniref:FG-GAP repeat domain-containing protein n=1 Tax=Phycicoccus avicenniae TaxID=2828860 RepID=UPI003D29989D